MELTDVVKYGGFPATETPRRQSTNIEDRRDWKSPVGPNMDFVGFQNRFDPKSDDLKAMSKAEQWEAAKSRITKQGVYENARKPISLEDPEGVDISKGKISLLEPTAPIPHEVADERSQKASFAQGEKSQGIDVLYNQLVNGHEDVLRQGMAAEKQGENQRIKSELLQSFAEQRAFSGKPLSKDEYEFAAALTTDDLVNPETILEKEYARQVLKQGLGDSTILKDAVAEDQAASDVLLDVAEQTIAKREIVQTEIDKTNSEWNDTSWFKSIWDFGETLIPFKSALTVSGTIIGSGSELEAYVANLYRLPVDEFAAKFRSDLEDIKSRNALDAQHFAGLVQSYGTSAKFLDNALNVADLLSVVSPAAKGLTKSAAKVATETDFVVGANGVARAATAQDRLAGGIRSLITSLRTNKLNVAETLAGAGKHQAAGYVNFLKDMKSKYYDKDPEGLSKTLLSHMPTFMNPSKFFGGGYQMSREGADRIAAKAERNSGALLRGLTDKTGINTLSDAALARAYNLAEEEVRGEFTHINNSILDVVKKSAEDDAAGVGKVQLHLGLPEGKPFENRHQAEHWRKEYGLSTAQARPVQQGDSYVLEINRPLRETQESVKDAFLETSNVTPKSSVNMFLGHILSADDSLSEQQRAIRKVTVHGTQFLSQMLETATTDLRALSKGSRLRFTRFAESMRDHVYTGPKGEKLRGREFTTMGEFEESWQESFGRLPSEAETSAYLSYQQLNQFDYLLRNLSVYRFKVRKGVREFKADKSTPFFEGTTVDKIDWSVRKSDGTVGVLVFKEGQEPSYTTLQFAKASTREEIDALVSGDGYKVIQTWDPFAFETNGPVNLVVTKNAESRNLAFEQIPYRPGGHVVYDYDHYVKQPSVTMNEARAFYSGDKTISPFTTEAEARKYVKNMEEARRLYNESAPDAFDDFVWKNLPVTPQDLRQKYSSGMLDKDQPFVYTHRGNSTKQALDQSKSWIDWNESSYNLSRGMNKEFLGTRNWDSMAVHQSVDEENPVFELTKPRLLDPLSTINRAAGKLIRNEYLEPYKIRSAESFVEEFHEVLNGTLKDLRRDPIGVLFDEASVNKTANNREMVAAAENYRRAVLDLLGVRSPFQRNWGRVQEKLLNSIYNKMGQGASDWTYEKLLPGVRDPVKFGRQVAFHSKLGLLNPVQLFLQAQTFIHTTALAPREALQAGPGAVLMRLLEVGGRHVLDDAFLDKWAKHAGVMGWKSEDFKEAYRFVRRSGIFNVNGEHAWRDDMLDPKLVRNTVGKYLDKAAIFFTEGERFNRLAAFNAAYLGWRKANPLAKFDRKAQEVVMARQDILSVNMTRASNASWQKGFLSVPTQFFSYQQRLFEQLAGKRLSKAEKARVLATYSMMYGVPVAAGAATMWPMYETVKSYMLENGISYDNAAFEMMMEGIPAVAIEALTGTQYNIGDRYGPGGLKDLRDIWWGDKALLEVALGASGSILGDILKTSKPFLYSIAELSQEGSKALPLIGQDFVDALSNVSTVNNAYRAYYALQYQKLITKGEVVLDNEVSTVDAIVTGITGLQDQRLGDMFLMIDSMKHQKDAQKFARDQAIKYFRRGIKAPDDQKELFFRQYKTWLKLGGFTVDQHPSILKDAAEGFEDLLGSIEKRFWESAPEDQQAPRLEQYNKRNQ
jgi:hypothetical protein